MARHAESEGGESRGTATRRRIVEEATRLIYERGYGKTTVDQVIESAGVTKGSFYYHFPTKQELGYAVIDNASSCILGRIDHSLEDRRLSPVARIERMLEEVQSMVEVAECSRGCILGNLALEMGHGPEGFRLRIASAFQAWSSLIAGQLEEMKASGELAADADCRSYADFAVSALEGGIMMSKLARDPAPVRNSISLILELFRKSKDR